MDADALKQMMEELIPFNRFLGIKVAGIHEGVVHLTLAFRPEFVGDPMRPALHGGVMSTLADVAGGLAVWTGLDDVRSRVATIDLRIDYLRPGRLERLDAHARVVRKGNRVGVVDVNLFHPEDRGAKRSGLSRSPGLGGAAPIATGEDEIVATGKGVYNIVMHKQK